MYNYNEAVKNDIMEALSDDYSLDAIEEENAEEIERIGEAAE